MGSCNPRGTNDTQHEAIMSLRAPQRMKLPSPYPSAIGMGEGTERGVFITIARFRREEGESVSSAPRLFSKEENTKLADTGGRSPNARRL